MLIRLLNCMPAVAPGDRKRLWLAVGETITLGNSVATAQYLIVHNCRLPMLVLNNPTWGRNEIVLTKAGLFDIRRYAPLILIPRAFEMDSKGIPIRFFLEFAARVQFGAVEVAPGLPSGGVIATPQEGA